MTRQYPSVKLELEAREQSARNRVHITLWLIGAVLTAVGLAGGAWVFVLATGGAL